MGQAMSSGGEELPADSFWAAVRKRYEDGHEAVSAIAKDVEISAQALISRARSGGWKLRGAASKKSIGTRETIARLKALLQQRLSDLENQIGALGEATTAATSEREIRSMNTLVRTLEKVLELERKERAQRKRQRSGERLFNDAEREALAYKLDGLCREIEQAREPEQAKDSGGPETPGEPGNAGAEPRLAPVGT